MEITSGFRLDDPSGTISTRSTEPGLVGANPHPTWLKTEWDERAGVARETTIFTELDAIRINTHEIPALIEKLQAHLVSINEKGGLPR